MPLLPPIELIPDSDYSRRVTKKRRLESPDRTPLERPIRQHCSECSYMLPTAPIVRQHKHRRHHPYSLNGDTTRSISILRAPATACDTASIQDPVTPPRRPVPLENESNDHTDDDEGHDGPEDDQRKRLARKQLPWLYRASRTSPSPCSSTDSLPLITPSSSYHQSRPIPVSIASSSTPPRSIFGASPLSRDMPIHWAEHQDPTPIWADAWDDDTDMDNGSDLTPWDYPSSSTTPFDPVSLDTPTPSASTSTSRTPRARARQSRHPSTRSYQPYWSVSHGRANMRATHARTTSTRSAALETAQSTLPSWMRPSNTSRPSWRHSLIGTCSSPNETDKDLSPPPPPPPTRPVTPPMKFSASSFHLSALKLR